jgi:hypothetical protein
LPSPTAAITTALIFGNMASSISSTLYLRNLFAIQGQPAIKSRAPDTVRGGGHSAPPVFAA